MAHLTLGKDGNFITSNQKKRTHISINEKGNVSKYYEPKIESKPTYSVLPVAKTKYNNFNDALNSMASFSDYELNQAKTEASRMSDYHKQKVYNLAKQSNVEIDYNKDFIKGLGSYRSEGLKENYYNRYNESNKYKKITPADTAKISDKKYKENEEKFNNIIKPSEEYQDYEDYAYRALPLIKETQNIRDSFNKKTTVLDKLIAPFVGGTSSGLNNTFLPTSDTYKLANGENVKTSTKSELNAQRVMSEIKDDDWWGKIYSSASYSLGNMLPSIGAGAINPALGATVMASNTYNQAYDSSLKEGYSKEQANRYAIANTTLELGLGKALGGMSSILGKSGLNEVISKSLSKVLANKATRDYLAEIGSEFTEEYLQEIIDPVVRNITLGENNKFKPFTKEALIAGVSGSLNAGISNYSKFKYDSNREKIYTKENVTNLINSQSQNSLENSIVNSAVNNAINKNEINLPKINNDSKTSSNEIISKLSKNGNFSEQVDKYINKSLPSGDVLYLGNTPEILQNLGINNNPIILKQSKLKSLLSNGDMDSHNHSLNANLIKNIPNALANPLNILKSSTQENSVVVITDLADVNENPIIASITLNDKGQIGNVSFLSNRLSSAYGKNDYDAFMKREIAKGNLLYDIDEGIKKELPTTGLQLPKGISSFSNNNNSINNYQSQSTLLPINNMPKNNVNLPGITKYSQNNTQSNIYTYEQSDNVKINNLRQSASKYFNNTEQAHNFINTIEKITSDKGYNILFDDTLSNKNGNQINAQITNLDNGEVEIRLNPNSERSGEFLIMHEVTHAIETDAMKNLVLDYANKHSDFNQALESLKQTYGTQDVSSEVLADISGQLFGNQEFINSLSTEKPNIFKRIYNSIISLANKITGNSNEALFIKDLKAKWEEAYRTQNNNLSESKFSIQQDANGNKYVNVDTDQNIFDGVNPKDYGKVAKQYILDNFREKGINFNEEKIDVSSRTAKEYAYPKTKLPYYIKDSKMKASTELDNLLTVSTYQYSKNDDGRHSFATDGWDYYKTKFTVGNKTFEGLVNIGKNGNKKALYDITNLKEVPYIGTSDKAFSESLRTPLNDNTLPQSKDSVKLPNKYSMQNTENNTNWQNYIEDNYKLSGTKTNMQDIKLPTIKSDNITNDSKPNLPINSEVKNNKTLDPIEISNLTREDANTTPKLPNINRNNIGDGESKFYNNIKDKTNMLNEQEKHHILSDEEVKYYDKVTNKESLNKAFERLNKNGKSETLNWFDKDSKRADATDVAEGYILMKQYADNGDYDSMVAVAKKMRKIGTEAGQTVQAFNIMERMTPEGMVKYAQSELLEAYDNMVKNKSKEWIDKYKSDFDLTPNEVKTIMDTMQEVAKMDDGYDKRVKLAEIQKLMTDKLPPQKGAKIKSWMRISMLFNPKTQVRNVVGNAIIAPVNYFGDMFSSYADKLISKKTGTRTTGNINVKAILKGFKEGAWQATNDYKKGINTKDMEGNRFEIGQGKSFSDKNAIGRSLNRVEGLLNYVMDAGDRMFSQSSFENSLQNQMILNNTTEITQDMIDISRTESLQRTWNDNNNYTKFVLDIRRGLNRFGTENYGLGDILIPFAKTPANLTKAIVDYSPAGLINTLIQGSNLKKSLSNGQYTPQMQHKFVQTLGKATAGTMLYIAGYALAKAGISSGESDDDKDTANFLKNTLGISSYSIKIGDKTFSYDWAQPLAAPLSITANIANSKNKGTALLEAVIGNLDTAGSVLLEQSFLESLNDVLSSDDGPISAIASEILELPSRAIPTFSKQIADMVDGTQRTTYEYDKPIKSAINSIKVKIPGLSKTLAPTVDTMGREIQKYGGKNNIFNVFLNPANVNTENISKSAKEIYDIYKETGNQDIMPRVAPYYINTQGNKITLNSSQRAEYQKISGKIIEDSVKELLNDNDYKKLNNEEKYKIIKSIVDYSYNKARKDVLNIQMSDTYNKINSYISNGGKVSEYYLNKEEIDYSLENPQKYSVINQITEYNEYQTYKKELDTLRENTKNKKADTINYINNLKLSIPQKAMFIKLYYSSFNDYNNQIVNYIKSQEIDLDDKETILKELGFTVKNGKVYW